MEPRTQLRAECQKCQLHETAGCPHIQPVHNGRDVGETPPTPDGGWIMVIGDSPDGTADGKKTLRESRDYSFLSKFLPISKLKRGSGIIRQSVVPRKAGYVSCQTGLDQQTTGDDQCRQALYESESNYRCGQRARCEPASTT